MRNLKTFGIFVFVLMLALINDAVAVTDSSENNDDEKSKREVLYAQLQAKGIVKRGDAFQCDINYTQVPVSGVIDSRNPDSFSCINVQAECGINLQDLQKNIAECEDDYSVTEEVCNPSKDKDMNGAMQAAQGISYMLGVGTSTNMAMACSNIANVSKIANIAIAGFNTRCKFNKEACEDSCGSVKEQIYHIRNSTSSTCKNAVGVALGQGFDYVSPEKEKMYSERYAACKKKDNLIEMSLVNMGLLAETMRKSRECEAMVQNQVNPCVQQPNLPQCQKPVNCADAKNKSNGICICQANPRDPACIAFMQSQNGGNVNQDPFGLNSGGHLGSSLGAGGSNRDFSKLTGEGGGGPGAGGPSFGGGSSVGSDFPIGMAPPGSPGNPVMENPGGGGRGISGGDGSGLGRGGGDDEGGGPGGSRFKSDILSTGRGGSGGAAGAGGAPAIVGRDANGNPIYGNPNAQVDLKQFLPGQKYDPQQRGIAGAYGPDGITGPNTNIWQKVNNRYNAQRSNLLP